MYATRIPLYQAFADLEVDNNGSLGATVETILTALGYTDHS